MTPIVKLNVAAILRTARDILVYVVSASLAFLGMIMLIREGKIAETVALFGAMLTLFCKVDQVVEKLDAIHQERILQYVRNVPREQGRS